MEFTTQLILWEKLKSNELSSHKENKYFKMEEEDIG